MGVMACDRRDCKHIDIMCDRMVNGKYICDYCWPELLMLKNSWPAYTPVNEIAMRIDEFMDTPAHTYNNENQAEIDAEFDRLTRNGNK